MSGEQPPNTIPVGAPIDADFAGRGGVTALPSVVRVICKQQNSAGTGFLHKSGRIITAEHVVRGCNDPIIVTSSGAQLKGSILDVDNELDIALINIDPPLKVAALPISNKNTLSIGMQVSTWGYPEGYAGVTALLSAGYIAGLQQVSLPSGGSSPQWIVNAAFNRGNSGGPLLQIETGEVIGVVVNKLAPISDFAASALKALANQKFGFNYTVTKPDNSQSTLTEGQIVGMVLDELRGQVQLSIGMAVPADVVRKYLQKKGIDP